MLQRRLLLITRKQSYQHGERVILNIGAIKTWIGERLSSLWTKRRAIVRAPNFDPSLRLSRIVTDNSKQLQTGERGSFIQNPWSSMFITPGYYVRESRFA